MYWFIPMLCIPSILPASVFYLTHWSRRAKEDRFPLALYIILQIIFSLAACVAGFAGGVMYGCFPPAAGNLCGLAGLPVGALASFVVASALGWLTTSFPLQMKRIVPVALVLAVAGGAYHFRYEFFGRWLVKDLGGLLAYRLQSADVEALQRYAPMMEAKLRDVRILKAVCLDSELTNDQAVVSRDQGMKFGALPTRTIKFMVVPPSTLNDAITSFTEIRNQLGVPKTFESGFGKAQSYCH